MFCGAGDTVTVPVPAGVTESAKGWSWIKLASYTVTRGLLAGDVSAPVPPITVIECERAPRSIHLPNS